MFLSENMVCSWNRKITRCEELQVTPIACSANSFEGASVGCNLELAHQFEHLVALCDFLHREIAQTLQTEGFHAETGQHTSVDHCLAQIVEMHFFHRAREIASHAAGERVPCPGWIVDVFKGVRAATEELFAFAKEQRAVLTFFDSNVGRPHFLHTESGLHRTRC